MQRREYTEVSFQHVYQQDLQEAGLHAGEPLTGTDQR